jgi:hypothetical protein
MALAISALVAARRPSARSAARLRLRRRLQVQLLGLNAGGDYLLVLLRLEVAAHLNNVFPTNVVDHGIGKGISNSAIQMDAPERPVTSVWVDARTVASVCPVFLVVLHLTRQIWIAIKELGI